MALHQQRRKFFRGRGNRDFAARSKNRVRSTRPQWETRSPLEWRDIPDQYSDCLTGGTSQSFTCESNRTIAGRRQWVSPHERPLDPQRHEQNSYRCRERRLAPASTCQFRSLPNTPSRGLVDANDLLRRRERITISQKPTEALPSQLQIRNSFNFDLRFSR